jgi:hypothetical protein
LTVAPFGGVNWNVDAAGVEKLILVKPTENAAAFWPFAVMVALRGTPVAESTSRVTWSTRVAESFGVSVMP